MEDSAEIIENFYGVYLLYCLNPKFKGRTYIGFTVNPNRRIKQHNTGTKAGGALKTSNKGPWDMVLIVHGFPNDISALRFEWAWQNPQKSRRLRNLPKKKGREAKYDYCLRILSHMLLARPWSRLPLTVRWLKQEYYREFLPGLDPPIHMPIAYGLVKPTKVSSPIKKPDIENNFSDFCTICKVKVGDNNFLRCLSIDCSMLCHIICLANHFLAKEETLLIPLEGSCPKCNLMLLWGDLVRQKKGCYQNLKDGSEKISHWADSLSQI